MHTNIIKTILKALTVITLTVAIGGHTLKFKTQQ